MKLRAPLPAPTPEAPAKADDLLSRVVKLVPGEVAAGYTALLAVVSSASHDSTVKYAAPTAILLCGVLLVMLIRRAGQTHQPPVKPHPMQYVVSVAAFLAWAFSIRNPLDGFDRELPSWICGFAIVLIPIFGGLLLQERPREADEGK
jgi:hypothetical protein